MKSRRFPLVLAVAAVWAALLGADVPAEELTADGIIEQYLATQDADSELAFVKMVQSAPGVEAKEYRFLVVHQKGEDGLRSYMLRLVRPKNVEGVSVIAVERTRTRVEQHLFLPAVGKSKELRGATRHGSFLGTEYSYEDLLREIPDVRRYERREDEPVRGRACYVVRAVEEEGESNYAWRDLYIDRETFQLWRVHFHDESGAHVKTFAAYDYGSEEIKGATTRPHRSVMTNASTGTWTDLTVIEGRLGEEFDAELFTTERMETWQPWEVEEFIFRFGIVVE